MRGYRKVLNWREEKGKKKIKKKTKGYLERKIRVSRVMDPC